MTNAGIDRLVQNYDGNEANPSLSCAFVQGTMLMFWRLDIILSLLQWQEFVI
jgi:hypothetical protein